MLRRLLGALTGYIAMAVVVMITLFLGALIATGHLPNPKLPQPPVTGNFIAVELLGGAVAALAGGWVAARIGRDRRSAWILAVAVLAIGLFCAIRPPAGEPNPRWILLALPWIGAAGALLGARFWKDPTD